MGRRSTEGDRVQGFHRFSLFITSWEGTNSELWRTAYSKLLAILNVFSVPENAEVTKAFFA
jgi:hypothetical protein